MNRKTLIILLIFVSQLATLPVFSRTNIDTLPTVDSLLSLADNDELPVPHRFYYAQQAYNLALEKGDSNVFKAQLYMYERKKQLHEYAEAFTHLQNALTSAKKRNNLLQQMKALNLLGQYFADTGQPQEAIEKYEELDNLAQKNEAFRYVYMSKLNLSDLFFTQKNTQKTIEFAQLARENAHKINYGKGVALANINLAWGHFLKKQYTETHQFIDAAQLILDTMQHLDKHMTAEVFWINGRVSLVEGKETDAIQWFQKCAALGQDCEKDARTYLAQAYEKRGDYANAMACYRSITRLDSITLANLVKETAKNTASSYQLLKEKERNETLKNEQWRLYASIPIGFLIVLIFYQRYKNIQSRKTLLEYQLEMSEKTRQLQELEQNKLQQQVETQKEDLRNMAVDITHKNDFLTELEQKIKALSMVPEGNLQELETLVRQNTLNNQQNLVEFKWQVEALNSIFYKKLHLQAPDLSANELEICGLIRLNLSSKEIASIRNIEPKSVDMSRYRLRQKLGLKQGEDLTTVLKSI
jgi:DNA-binding CsgD family transcriptional regulator